VIRKGYALFIILHYNHCPMLLVNFKMSQGDFKESTWYSCFANLTTIHQIFNANSGCSNTH